jgi:hypothetical protein
MSVRITSLFFPFSLNVLVYTHVSVGVFTRTPFLPYPADGFDFSTDGAQVDAWLYFLGLKR